MIFFSSPEFLFHDGDGNISINVMMSSDAYNNEQAYAVHVAEQQNSRRILCKRIKLSPLNNPPNIIVILHFAKAVLSRTRTFTL